MAAVLTGCLLTTPGGPAPATYAAWTNTVRASGAVGSGWWAAPTPPALSLVGNSATGGQLWSWTATGQTYRVELQAANGTWSAGPWGPLAATSLAYNPGMGSTYAARVVAVNPAGQSAPSNPVTVTQPTNIPAPTAPSVNAITGTTVKYNWPARTATEWQIRYRVNGGALVGPISTGTALSYTIAGLTPGDRTALEVRYRPTGAPDWSAWSTVTSGHTAVAAPSVITWNLETSGDLNVATSIKPAACTDPGATLQWRGQYSIDGGAPSAWSTWTAVATGANTAPVTYTITGTQVARATFELKCVVNGTDSPVTVHQVADVQRGGTGSPTGRADTVQPLGGGRLRVYGWAFDPDFPTASIPVHVYADGVPYSLGPANLPRPDVDDFFGGGLGDYHGYDSVIQVAVGARRVTVWAVNVSGGGSVVLFEQIVTIT